MVNGKFKGGKQIGKQKWLPYGSSPTAKMGVLDKDGNPGIPPTGEKAKSSSGETIDYKPRSGTFAQTSLLDSDTVSGAGKSRISKENLDAVGGVLSPPIVQRTGIDSYRVLDGGDALASTNARGDSMTRAFVTDAQGASSMVEQRAAFRRLKPKFEDSPTPMKVSRERQRSQKLETDLLDLDTIGGMSKADSRLAKAMAKSDTLSVIPILKQTGVDKYEVVYGKEAVASYHQARKLNPNLPDRMRAWVARSEEHLQAMKRQIEES